MYNIECMDTDAAMKENLNNTMAAIAHEMGADLIGFSDVCDAVDEDLRALPRCITVGIHLSEFVISNIGNAPTYTYFQHYRTVNALLDSITTRLVIELQRAGFDAMAIPASQSVKDREGEYRGVFPHKTGAVRSGLGWIGRSGLFVSRKFGPRVRLGSVLTNAELAMPQDDFDPEKAALEICGKCGKCAAGCPAGAIAGGIWYKGAPREHMVDAEKCSTYMTKQYGHIGRGSVCGRCVYLCPVGKSDTNVNI